MMAEDNKPRGGSSPAYVISSVRKGTGPHEYVVTLARDGKPVGDVTVRAAL